MLIRGAIQDRLWGKTLGALGRRAVTGQLSIRSGNDSYAIVFDGGHVVAASAPGTTELGLALVQELLDVSQVAELERRDDREQQLAALLTPDQLLRLRRQTIAAAATRTFALTTGDFVFDSEVSLPVVANTAMHIGGIIYHGVTQLDDERLAGALRELGTTFRSRADGIPDLQYFGFGEAELIVVRALTDGISMQQIEHLPPTERRIASAVIYTLASLGSLYCEAPVVAPRMARGTADPTPPGPAIARTQSGGIPRPAGPRISSISIPTHQPRLQPRGTQPLHTPAPQVAGAQGDADRAPAHYRRGQAALRDERLDDAIAAFTLAMELVPDSHDYKCALAWARFCKAQDKSRVADATRAVLSQAVLRSENPVSAYYYLGMVERMLGRTTQAMTAFQQVLDLDPNHREAGTELRFLSRNSGPIKR